MQPIKRITSLMRSDDQTLTEAEKQAAISELMQDKERQQEQIDQSDGGPKTN